jgi:hypothetical protein
LAKSGDASFMNRVHLALSPADDKGGTTGQARAASAPGSDPQPARSAGGVLAEGLKKLLRRDA